MHHITITKGDNKMKKIVLGSIITLFLILNFNSAFAAWSFDLESDFAEGNSQVTFSLNLNVSDETIDLMAYQFEFKYDSNELEYSGYTNNNPFNSVFMDPNAFSNNSEGTLDSFMVLVISPFGAHSASVNSGAYTIGTFTFDIKENAIADEESDFGFDYNDNMFALTVNNTNYSANSGESLETITAIGSGNFDVTSASAVPIPTALLLMGAGLLGVAGLRRKIA